MTHTARTGQWHQHTDRIMHMNESCRSFMSNDTYENVSSHDTNRSNLKRRQHTDRITHVNESWRSFISYVTYELVRGHDTYSSNRAVASAYRSYHTRECVIWFVDQLCQVWTSHSVYHILLGSAAASAYKYHARGWVMSFVDYLCHV